MTFVDTFAQPDDLGPIRASELHEGIGSALGATIAETLDPQSGVSAYQIWRRANRALAGNPDFMPALADAPGAPPPARPDEIPDVPIADAKARVKQEGLDGLLPLPDQPSIKQPVLDLMINEAHEHRDRQTAIARGPQGFFPSALEFATSIGAGMIDPVNVAAFSIPVLGEARWGKMLASAGDSVINRAGVRALQGAAQGAAGTALLQPADWWFHTQDGRDYTMAEALRSVALGAGMGAAFHAGIGAVGDLGARVKGLPLPGSTEETLARALQPQHETPLEGRTAPQRAPEESQAVEGTNSEAAPRLAEAVATPEALPPGHPAHVLADLPEVAREDVHRAAAADIIAGRPVRVAEMLQEAAKADPRIAETIDAWHGSPHAFDAFSLDRIGSGEGADSYGHGLYFAEHQDVAAHYQAALSPGLGDMPGGIKSALKSIDYLGFNNASEAIFAIRQHPTTWMRNWDVDPTRSPEERAAVTAITDYVQANPRGHLYRVRIKANRDDLLDWDANAREQPPGLGLAYERAGMDLSGATTGEDAYRQLTTRRAASKALHEAGVPGLKYLDQISRANSDYERDIRDFGAANSRDAGTLAKKVGEREQLLAKPAGDARTATLREVGREIDHLTSEIKRRDDRITEMRQVLEESTRNFVVFSDKDVEITHKNGEPVQRNVAAMPQAVPTDGEIARDLGRGSAKAEKQQSLLQFLRARGGLKPHGEIDAVFGGKRLDLLRKNGMSLDEAREAAVEAGYLHDPGRDTGRPSESTIRDLLDGMDAENRGDKLYPPGADVKGRDHELDRLEGELTAGFHELGQNWSDVPKRTRDRALHIMYTEGVEDPVAAYERAVLEEDYYAEKSGRIRRVTGNELPAEQRAAQATGAGDQTGRGTGEPGGPARQSGVDDRSPDWQQFAEQRAEHDDPQLVAESNEAARTEEPASIAPERAVSAAEKAAADARELLADMKPRLSDEEWNSLEEALSNIDTEKGVGEQIVRDGAACLAAAVGF